MCFLKNKANMKILKNKFNNVVIDYAFTFNNQIYHYFLCLFFSRKI